MSEFIQKNDNRATIRWKLLTGTSALALLAYTSSLSVAKAEDTDRPVFWLEFGDQLDRLGDAEEAFNPPFMAAITKPGLLSALDVQRSPTYALDEDGKISFQPEHSDWVLSASIRYGRSGASAHKHQQTANAKIPMHFTFYGKYFGGYSYYPSGHVKFSDGTSTRSETHTVADFQAGKDVGLGIFGSATTSTISTGVRFAQFGSKSNVELRALPDLQYPTAPITSFFQKYDFKHPDAVSTQRLQFHAFTGIASLQRSFHGVGPSLTWTGSAPFAGNQQEGELMLDWGANTAVLFGRQTVKGRHQTTTVSYQTAGYWVPYDAAPNLKGGRFFATGTVAANKPPPPRVITVRNIDRSRSVSVPNVGGSIGVSYRVENLKVSMGYRADFFFGAIDGGIDTRKSENRAFYGPYASISVGIGD